MTHPIIPQRNQFVSLEYFKSSMKPFIKITSMSEVVEGKEDTYQTLLQNEDDNPSQIEIIDKKDRIIVLFDEHDERCPIADPKASAGKWFVEQIPYSVSEEQRIVSHLSKSMEERIRIANMYINLVNNGQMHASIEKINRFYIDAVRYEVIVVDGDKSTVAGYNLMNERISTAVSKLANNHYTKTEIDEMFNALRQELGLATQ